MAGNHKSQYMADDNHNQRGTTSQLTKDSAERHRTTNKINSHHKQRHQAADKHRTAHVPDRRVTSRHHTREATNEGDDVPLTDSLHTTNTINHHHVRDEKEGDEQPSTLHKRGSISTSGETMLKHPGIAADSEGDDSEEDHMASGKSELVLAFQEVNYGCYNSLTHRQVEEGGSDIHYQSCTLCECLENKLYCIKYCQV